MSKDFRRPSINREGALPRMIKRQKYKSCFGDGKVLRSLRMFPSKNNPMSTETQYFIQKFCYKKTASIDMTRHGFINDSKVNPVNYVMKPLRAQLEKICVKHVVNRTEAVTSAEQKPPCIPKSALSSPGSRSLRTRCRVRIQSEPNPGPEVKQMKVKLVSPNKNIPRTPIKKKIQVVFSLTPTDA